MPDLIVDYDIIIKIQTLSWEKYDTEVIFDRANHSDLDVHVSLLYEVAEDTSVEDYSSIRVAYPADADARIGYLTPPASPRKFREERITGNQINEAAHEYVGDITVSPIGTKLGVKQALLFKNITGVSSLIIPDSPLTGGLSKTFDASEWIDKVYPLLDTIVDPHTTSPSIHAMEDKWDHIISIVDNIVFDYLNKIMSGYIQINYDHNALHIKQLVISLSDGLNLSYNVTGVGEWASAESPIIINIYQNFDKFTNLEDIKRNESLKLSLLARGRSEPSNTFAYKWLIFDKGWNTSNWRADYISVDYGWSLHANTVFSSNTQTTPQVMIRPDQQDLSVDHEVIIDRDQMWVLSHLTVGYGTVHTNHFGEEINETLFETIETAYDLQNTHAYSFSAHPSLTKMVESSDVQTVDTLVVTLYDVDSPPISNNLSGVTSLYNW